MADNEIEKLLVEQEKIADELKNTPNLGLTMRKKKEMLYKQLVVKLDKARGEFTMQESPKTMLVPEATKAPTVDMASPVVEVAQSVVDKVVDTIVHMDVELVADRPLAISMPSSPIDARAKAEKLAVIEKFLVDYFVEFERLKPSDELFRSTLLQYRARVIEWVSVRGGDLAVSETDIFVPESGSTLADLEQYYTGEYRNKAPAVNTPVLAEILAAQGADEMQTPIERRALATVVASSVMQPNVTSFEPQRALPMVPVSPPVAHASPIAPTSVARGSGSPSALLHGIAANAASAEVGDMVRFTDMSAFQAAAACKGIDVQHPNGVKAPSTIVAKPDHRAVAGAISTAKTYSQAIMNKKDMMERLDACLMAVLALNEEAVFNEFVEARRIFPNMPIHWRTMKPYHPLSAIRSVVREIARELTVDEAYKAQMLKMIG